MQKLNAYGLLVCELLDSGKDVICIDIKCPIVKRLYAKKLGFIWADIVIGSRKAFYSALDELNILFIQTNLKKLLDSKGYSLRNGRKYIFAFKQPRLDLF